MYIIISLNKNTYTVSIYKMITLLSIPDRDDEQQYIVNL